MGALLFAAFLCFGMVHQIVLPVLRYNRRRDQQRFEYAYSHFKAMMVRQHYVAVQDLSLNEIRELFDVDEAYDRISVRLLEG